MREYAFATRLVPHLRPFGLSPDPFGSLEVLWPVFLLLSRPAPGASARCSASSLNEQ